MFQNMTKINMAKCKHVYQYIKIDLEQINIGKCGYAAKNNLE